MHNTGKRFQLVYSYDESYAVMCFYVINRQAFYCSVNSTAPVGLAIFITGILTSHHTVRTDYITHMLD